MAERREAVEEQAVRDGSAVYSVEAEIANSEDLPPGYKRTEVGVIPEDWQAQQIGSLAQIKRGASPRPIADSKWFDTKSEIGWLRISDVAREGKFIRATDQSLSDAGVARSRLVRPGNVVMSMAATVGRPAINRKTVCIHDGFVVFEKPTVSSEFLYYLLLAIEDRWAERGQTGSQVNLNTHIIGTTPVPLPAIEAEQRAIAAALSDADALIESLDRLIAKKRVIKQATMQQLLTGQTRLPGFTGEWETKRLGEIGRFRGGSGFPTVFQGETSGQYPFFKVSDMNNEGNETFMESASNYISDTTRKKLGAVVFPAKSIVFAKVGAAVFLERKKILSRPSCLDNNMAGFTLEDPPVNFRFIHYVLMSFSLGALVSTTALPSLNSKVLASIMCRLPSLKEQQAIATVLSDMDTEIEALERRHDKARQIKQGMMQQLLTGRVRLV